MAIRCCVACKEGSLQRGDSRGTPASAQTRPPCISTAGVSTAHPGLPGCRQCPAVSTSTSRLCMGSKQGSSCFCWSEQPLLALCISEQRGWQGEGLPALGP